MSNYIPEFIQYLKDGFGISREIVFELKVDPLQLDVSKAVPVALIINEAVTNSIKYAFPEKRKGMIKVELTKKGDDVLLAIADNGVGISPNIKDTKLNSLGLELMKGLCEDIDGHIAFENDHGTRIAISFKMDSIYENKNVLNTYQEDVALT